MFAFPLLEVISPTAGSTAVPRWCSCASMAITSRWEKARVAPSNLATARQTNLVKANKIEINKTTGVRQLKAGTLPAAVTCHVALLRPASRGGVGGAQRHRAAADCAGLPFGR